MDCDERNREHKGRGQDEEKGLSHRGTSKSREQGLGNREQQERQLEVNLLPISIAAGSGGAIADQRPPFLFPVP
jgi:hypothetical protein